METLFLNILQAINNNWFWVGPIIATTALVMAAREMIGVMQDELGRLRGQRSEVGGQRSEVRYLISDI